MKLRELLQVFNKSKEHYTQDIDIYHWEIDDEYPTTVNLSLSSFTPEGLEKFSAVLDSEVVRIDGRGEGWFAVFVEGVKSSKLAEFCEAHAGECSVEDWQKWFVED